MRHSVTSLENTAFRLYNGNFFSYIKLKVTIKDEASSPTGALSAPPYLVDSFFATKRGDNSHTLHSPILISCKQNILASYPYPYHNYQSIFHLVKFIKEQKKEGDKQVIRERTKIFVYNT